MSKKFTFHSPYQTYEECYFVRSQYYHDNSLCIEVYNNEVGPISRVTICPDFKLNPGEIAIKDYSENVGMLLEMQKLGLVKEVVRLERQGFVQIPVCTYDEKILKEYS